MLIRKSTYTEDKLNVKNAWCMLHKAIHFPLLSRENRICICARQCRRVFVSCQFHL